MIARIHQQSQMDGYRIVPISILVLTLRRIESSSLEARDIDLGFQAAETW